MSLASNVSKSPFFLISHITRTKDNPNLGFLNRDRLTEDL